MNRLAWLFVAWVFVGCGDAGTGAGPAVPVGADAAGQEDVVAVEGDLYPTITSPDDGAVLAVGATQTFQATVAGSHGVATPVAYVWSSDVHGPLDSGTVDGLEISLITSALDPGAHRVTLAVSDALGREGEVSIEVLLDRPPEGVTVVTISPPDPQSGDPLLATVTDFAMDPDGEPVTYTFSWFADGLPAAIAGDSVPHTKTVRGQTWRVLATPFDGTSSGPPGEDEVVIGNGIPLVESALILPSVGGTDTPFSCSGSGFSDADGDEEVYEVTWLVNDQAVDGVDGLDITGEHYARGDELVCVLTPVDAYDQGLPVASEPVPIVDTPPSVDGAILDPIQGDVTTTFSCAADGLSDPDAGDEPAVQTVWIAKGETLPGTTSTTFVPGDLAKGDTLKCRIVPFVGEVEGSPADSVEITLGNALPVSGAVVMLPVPPTEATGITCVPAEAFDPDGDNVAYGFAWYVDGELVDGVGTDTLTGANYDKDQEVTCSAIPFDGTDSGEPADSKFSVIVANSVPTLDGVVVSPAEGSKKDLFTCTPVGWSDLDPIDEPVFSYGWKMNGQDVPGGIFETLTPTGLPPGDLTCVVTPGDGSAYGVPVESPPALVTNHAPSITGVALGPSPAYEETTLQCTPEGWLDEDDDPEGYQFGWTVNGTAVEGADQDSLAGADFDKGQIVLCTAIPNDGAVDGQGKASNPVQISNTAPTLQSATITPLAGNKQTSYTCTPNGFSDPDPADGPLYVYGWLADGVLIDGATEGSFVPGSTVSDGQQLHCRVTPFDGADYGAPVESGSAVISNAPPFVSDVAIQPPQPGPSDDLTCVAGLIGDPDGDQVTASYVWVKNGSPVPGEEGATLGAALTSEGDLIQCQITPDDGELVGPGSWSSEVTIGPSALVAPVVDVTPDSPSPAGALSCNASYPGPDPAGVTLLYAWARDGVIQGGYEDAALPAGVTQACETWSCIVVATDGASESDPAEDWVTVGAGGDGDVTWHGHHSYDPVDNPGVQQVNQWYSLEIAATRVDLSAGLFPFTVTHLRAYGALGQGYAIRVYANQGGLPGSVLAETTFVGTGGQSEIALATPLDLDAAAPVWIGVQGDTDFWSVYGDGDGEATSNAAYTCLALLGECWTPPSWGGMTFLGPPFSGLGDLILDLGTASGGDGTCP